MGNRQLLTISLPPRLLKKTEEVAAEEDRTKSELVREAIRWYIETRDVRKKAAREQLAALLNQSQSRARDAPARDIRRIVSDAVRASRRRRTAG